MKLTDVERLTLMNQYIILAALEDTDEYDKFIKILGDGYEGDYDELVVGFDETLSADDCRFVRDVLSMYEMIQRAGEELAVEELTEHFNYPFKGFDGNNETMHMSYARFLTQDRGLWSFLKFGDDGCNSHMPRVDKYRNMLSRWVRSKNKYELTQQDVLDILEA